VKLVFTIALRHLRSPQKGSFSTFAGIMAILGLGLGIAALILTFAILEGFETTISEKIASFDGHLRIQHFMELPLRQQDALLDSILSGSPGSAQVTRYLQQPALLRRGQLTEGVIVVGMELENLPVSLATILKTGRLARNDHEIVMGDRLAQSMGVEVGGKVVLVDLETLGQLSSTRRMKPYTVSGLFHSGLLEYDKSIVYLSLAAAQDLFQLPDQVSGRILTLPDPQQVTAVYRYLEDQLPYPYYVLSWRDKHRVLFDWMNIQKWPILIVFGMIALVGVVNIVSALSMIVIEKLREIGTLLALGFRRARIRHLFLVEGLVIGLAGSTFGGGVALLLSYLQVRFQIFSISEDVYFMDSVPVEINLLVTAVILLSGVVAAVLAALGPTLKASRVQPAEVLRYE
jgi:lipoprotein-releasing system permease protein